MKTRFRTTHTAFFILFLNIRLLQPSQIYPFFIGQQARAQRKPVDKLKPLKALPASLWSTDIGEFTKFSRCFSNGIPWRSHFSSGNIKRPRPRSHNRAPGVTHKHRSKPKWMRLMLCDLGVSRNCWFLEPRGGGKLTLISNHFIIT